MPKQPNAKHLSALGRIDIGKHPRTLILSLLSLNMSACAPTDQASSRVTDAAFSADTVTHELTEKSDDLNVSVEESWYVRSYDETRAHLYEMHLLTEQFRYVFSESGSDFNVEENPRFEGETYMKYQTMREKFCAQGLVADQEGIPTPKDFKLATLKLDTQTHNIPVFIVGDDCDIRFGNGESDTTAIFQQKLGVIAVEETAEKGTEEHELMHAQNYYKYIAAIKENGISIDDKIPAGLVYKGQEALMDRMGLDSDDEISVRDLDEMVGFTQEMMVGNHGRTTNFFAVQGTDYDLTHLPQRKLLFGNMDDASWEELDDCHKNMNEGRCATFKQAWEDYKTSDEPEDAQNLLEFMAVAGTVGLSNMKNLAVQGTFSEYLKYKEAYGN